MYTFGASFGIVRQCCQRMLLLLLHFSSQQPFFEIPMLSREGNTNSNTHSDAHTVYYTAANYDRKPWRLQNGTPLSNSAFGAINLTTGTVQWETPVPANDTSLVPPSIVNDAILTGRSGSYAASGASTNLGPGSLIALDKNTGLIRGSWALDSFFQGAVAVVSEFVFFGTGYRGANGSFYVWKIGRVNATRL